MNVKTQNIRKSITDANKITTSSSSRLFSYRLIQNSSDNIEEPINYNRSTTFTRNKRILPNFLIKRKYIKGFEDSSEVY